MQYRKAEVILDIVVKNPDGVSRGVKSCIVEGEQSQDIDLNSERLKGKSTINVEITMGSIN